MCAVSAPTTRAGDNFFAMLIFVIIGLQSVVAADPPPYTFSLDQSIPCPRDLDDTWYSQRKVDAAPVLPNASTALAGVLSSIPEMLDGNMKTLNAPSAMFIAYQNGKKLFESYRGTARLHKAVPVTASSGFRIASNSKVFTSVMSFMLRDAGHLPQGLDTPVATIMPNWVEPAPPMGTGGRQSKRGLTLRALATHASGLPRECPHGHTEKEILDKIGQMKMLFPQYASTAYSNLGVSLLGRTLEKVTPDGLTWEDWVANKIMRPLGMKGSGPCLRTEAEVATIVDGVDPATGALIPIHSQNKSVCNWGAPAGEVFSTPHDMAIWSSFLAGTIHAPDVLDPSTVNEMRNSLMVQPDAISAVSGGTLESAFSHGRWTFNKLGCLDGYRSAITIVPQLGLSLFAAAASTCDIYGDGDAVGFPIVSKLIQPLEEILTKRFDDAQKSLPPTAADLIGRYKCGSGVSTIAKAADGTLQIDRLGTYPWSLLPLDGQPDAYRLLMRTLPMTHAGCESKEYPGANLCQPSCFRQMARGDIELLYARRNHSKVTEIEVPGEGIVCVKE